MKILLYDPSKTGGIYYYAKELEKALLESIEITRSLKDFWKVKLIHYQYPGVHTYKQILILFILFISKLAGKKVIITAHNPGTRGVSSHAIEQQLINDIFFWTANTIIIHNKTKWKWLHKSVIVPFGNYSFYLNYKENATKAELKDKLGINGKKVILCYGYLRPSKNIPLLLEVMKEVHKRREDTVLLIAGKISFGTPEELSLMNLPEYVMWINEENDLRKTALYFTISDVTVMTNTVHDYSAIPHIAYCFKNPIVGPECLRDQISIIARDKEDYVEKILKVLENPPDCEEEYLREMSEYSWENVAKKTLVLYKRCLI